MTRHLKWTILELPSVATSIETFNFCQQRSEKLTWECTDCSIFQIYIWIYIHNSKIKGWSHCLIGCIEPSQKAQNYWEDCWLFCCFVAYFLKVYFLKALWGCKKCSGRNREPVRGSSMIQYSRPPLLFYAQFYCWRHPTCLYWIIRHVSLYNLLLRIQQ